MNLPWKKAPSTASITPADLAKRLQTGERITVVDVREPFEWNSGHVNGAVHIPLRQLSNHLGQLPKDQPIAAMCRSGHRSAMAAEMLAKAGYNVLNVEGGYQAWKRSVGR